NGLFFDWRRSNFDGIPGGYVDAVLLARIDEVDVVRENFRFQPLEVTRVVLGENILSTRAASSRGLEKNGAVIINPSVMRRDARRRFDGIFSAEESNLRNPEVAALVSALQIRIVRDLGLNSVNEVTFERFLEYYHQINMQQVTRHEAGHVFDRRIYRQDIYDEEAAVFEELAFLAQLTDGEHLYFILYELVLKMTQAANPPHRTAANDIIGRFQRVLGSANAVAMITEIADMDDSRIRELASKIYADVALANGRQLPSKDIAEPDVDEIAETNVALNENFRMGTVIAITDEQLTALGLDGIEKLSADEIIELFQGNISNIEGERLDYKERVSGFWTRSLKSAESRKNEQELLKVKNHLKKLFLNRGSVLENHRYVVALRHYGVFDQVRVLGHAGRQEKTAGIRQGFPSIYLPLSTIEYSQLNEPALEAIISHEKEDLRVGHHQTGVYDETLIGQFWDRIREYRYFLGYQQLGADYINSHYSDEHAVRRGLFDLIGLYAGDDHKSLLTVIIDELPRDRKVKLLYLGSGRGVAVIDLIRQYPDLDLEIHIINKEAALVFDFEHLLVFLDPDIFKRYPNVRAAFDSKDPVVEEAKKIYKKLHAHVYPMDVSHGRGLDRLDDDFDFVLVGDRVLEYIPDQISVQEGLYRLLRKGGKLLSYFYSVANETTKIPIAGSIAEAIERRLGRDASRIIIKRWEPIFAFAVTKADEENLDLPFRYVRYDSQIHAELYDVEDSFFVQRSVDKTPAEAVEEVVRYLISKDGRDIRRDLVAQRQAPINAAIALIRHKSPDLFDAEPNVALERIETREIRSILGALFSLLPQKELMRVFRLNRRAFTAAIYTLLLNMSEDELLAFSRSAVQTNARQIDQELLIDIFRENFALFITKVLMHLSFNPEQFNQALAAMLLGEMWDVYTRELPNEWVDEYSVGERIATLSETTPVSTADKDVTEPGVIDSALTRRAYAFLWDSNVSIMEQVRAGVQQWPTRWFVRIAPLAIVFSLIAPGSFMMYLLAGAVALVGVIAFVSMRRFRQFSEKFGILVLTETIAEHDYEVEHPDGNIEKIKAGQRIIDFHFDNNTIARKFSGQPVQRHEQIFKEMLEASIPEFTSALLAKLETNDYSAIRMRTYLNPLRLGKISEFEVQDYQLKSGGEREKLGVLERFLVRERLRSDNALEVNEIAHHLKRGKLRLFPSKTYLITRKDIQDNPPLIQEIIASLHSQAKNVAEEGIDEIESIHAALNENFRRGSIISITDTDLARLGSPEAIDALSAEQVINLFVSNIHNIEGDVSRSGATRDDFDYKEAARGYWNQLIRGPDAEENLSLIKTYLKTLLINRGAVTESHRYIIPLGEEDVFTNLRVLAHAGMQGKTQGRLSAEGTNLRTQTKTLFISEKAVISGRDNREGLAALIYHEKGDLSRGTHAWSNPHEEDQVRSLWDQARTIEPEAGFENLHKRKTDLGLKDVAKHGIGDARGADQQHAVLNNQFITGFEFVDEITMAGEIGIKAMNLSLLFKLGAPVLPGASVKNGAFHAFFSQEVSREGRTLYDVIRDLSGSLNAQSSDEDYKGVEQSIQRYISQTPFPEPLRKAIEDAYAELSGSTGFDAFSVRSSSISIGEDSLKRGFPGMFSSILNCRGEQQIIEAIKKVWMSQWSKGALRYRVETGMTQTDAAMGVVLQAQLPSENSGVFYTRATGTDPLDEPVAELTVGKGLGTGVVDGKNTVAWYRLDSQGKILDKRRGDQKYFVVADRQGGTKRIESKRPVRDRLDEKNIYKLNRLVNETVEKFERESGLISPFGYDVEWAVHKGKIYIFQLRPIPIPSDHAEKDLYEVLAHLSRDRAMMEYFARQLIHQDEFKEEMIEEMMPFLIDIRKKVIAIPSLEKYWEQLMRAMGDRLRFSSEYYQATRNVIEKAGQLSERAGIEFDDTRALDGVLSIYLRAMRAGNVQAVTVADIAFVSGLLGNIEKANIPGLKQAFIDMILKMRISSISRDLLNYSMRVSGRGNQEYHDILEMFLIGILLSWEQVRPIVIYYVMGTLDIVWEDLIRDRPDLYGLFRDAIRMLFLNVEEGPFGKQLTYLKEVRIDHLLLPYQLDNRFPELGSVFGTDLENAIGNLVSDHRIPKEGINSFFYNGLQMIFQEQNFSERFSDDPLLETYPVYEILQIYPYLAGEKKWEREEGVSVAREDGSHRIYTRDDMDALSDKLAPFLVIRRDLPKVLENPSFWKGLSLDEMIKAMAFIEAREEMPILREYMYRGIEKLLQENKPLKGLFYKEIMDEIIHKDWSEFDVTVPKTLGFWNRARKQDYAGTKADLSPYAAMFREYGLKVLSTADGLMSNVFDLKDALGDAILAAREGRHEDLDLILEAIRSICEIKGYHGRVWRDGYDDEMRPKHPNDMTELEASYFMGESNEYAYDRQADRHDNIYFDVRDHFNVRSD
ncbi:MAG: PEP/pyruvate-binding domain-containing protein, partial [Chlamydiota bacterium]|nr:PEP/pyruvate-binding domain-containing protein [Chlamydiota bacterium]